MAYPCMFIDQVEIYSKHEQDILFRVRPYFTHIVEISTEPKTNFEIYIDGKLFDVTRDKSSINFEEIFNRPLNMEFLKMFKFYLKFKHPFDTMVQTVGIRNGPLELMYTTWGEEMVKKTNPYRYRDSEGKLKELIITKDSVEMCDVVEE